MPRRSRSSPVGDLLELMSMLPWWVSLAAGLIGYLVFHIYAEDPVTQPVYVSATDMASSIMPTAVRTLCQIGQYVFPIVSILAAINSAFGNKR